jgi:predicted AlkP superfamily phosphohydrolase/phosphomutase
VSSDRQRRLMIISLDGADGRLIDLATQDGMLPHLSALRNRGRAWPLSASKDDTDDSLWASFQYGVDVGHHGRWHFLANNEKAQSIFTVDREKDRDLFWDEVSTAGHRVAVIDVPKCRTVRPLNGIHLADWLVHGRYSQTPTSYPPALAAQVVARFGEAPASKCDYKYDSPFSDTDARTARQNMLRSVEMKRNAGLHFLSQEPWDLFVLAFKETHCSAHMFWDIHDCDHRNHDQDKRARIGDPVIDILKAVDLAIGDLIAKAGPD